jgi:hypothetical protein
MTFAKALTLVLMITGSLSMCSCTGNEISVETGDITDIQATTADVTGHVLCTGDGIKQYGHCYSLAQNPSVSDSHTVFSVAIGTGYYTSHLVNLEPGTKYYVRAYASSGKVTVYGTELSLTTPSSGR